MRIMLKWSNLTNEQRAQIKDFYSDELQRKEMFEHNLNSRTYNINPNSGNVVFSKDF